MRSAAGFNQVQVVRELLDRVGSPDIEDANHARPLHVAAYAGFPAAMSSVRKVDAAFNKLDGLSADARRERPAADAHTGARRIARGAPAESPSGLREVRVPVSRTCPEVSPPMAHTEPATPPPAAPRPHILTRGP